MRGVGFGTFYSQIVLGEWLLVFDAIHKHRRDTQHLLTQDRDHVGLVVE